MNTKIWSLRKSTLIDGPNIDHRLEEHSYRGVPFCTATLNRSHFVMIAFKYYQQDPTLMPNRRFALIDFPTQQITDYPNLPLDEDFFSCSASMMIGKSNEKSVVIHLKTKFKKIRHLMSFDLNQGLEGQWKFHGTWEPDHSPNVLNFWQLRGSYYSLLSDGNLIHHHNLYDWHTLANFPQNFSKNFGNGAIYYV